MGSVISPGVICGQGTSSDRVTASFYIDSVSEIQFNETAFDSLVLPGARKELILAFAESQLKCNKTFDDVIQGKGATPHHREPP